MSNGNDDGLEVFADGYPRAIYFRQTEAPLSAVFDPDEYLIWEARYVDLDGIIGKVLGEELVTPRHVAREYFRRFKERHPSKLVLLHFNGQGRRPLFHGGRFSARHWLYLAGTTVIENVDETDDTGAIVRIKVEDAARFKLARAGDQYPDDIVIVPPGGDQGEYRWADAQHVALLETDPATDTIVVRRGVWDFSPSRRVEAGSYIAPHARRRPPVVGDETLWLYNFASPALDGDQPSCVDVLVDELRGYFTGDGLLASLDGVQFDVLYFVPQGLDAAEVDVDNDGKSDRGFVDHRNVFGIGVTDFGQKLREALPDKLLLADGMQPESHQRNFGTFNGIESEGFPIHRDPDFAEWSGALNRHAFWQSRGDSPQFNYLVFKYVADRNNIQGDNPGDRTIAYARFRLAAAAAVFTDAAFAVNPNAPHAVGAGAQVFDELWNGKAETTNWLGEPLGPALNLATRTPDLCNGGGVTWPPDFVEPIRGATVSPEDGHVRISWADTRVREDASDTGAPLRKVTVPIPTPLPGGTGVHRNDLFVEVTISGDPVPNYPPGIARRVRFQAFVDGKEVPTRPPHSDDNTARFSYTWVDREPFTATFLFRDAPRGPAELVITAEGGTDLFLHRLTAHAARGEVAREFRHGVVIANPSFHTTTIDLTQVFPGQPLRHVDGHNEQVLAVNDGLPVTGPITLQGLDARFLVKDPEESR